MSPTTSWPNTAGIFVAGSPSLAMSDPQRPQPLRRNSTSPGPIAGLRQSPAARPGAGLAPGRHGAALPQHADPARPDLVEQRPVDSPHDLRRHQRARVLRRAGLLRGPVELPGPRRLVAHEAHELVGVASGPEIVRGPAERPEVSLRQVHPAR